MPHQPHAPVRVLLDVSLLGRVHNGPRRSSLRTGIHRVVEQTARSLAAAPGVRVTLGAQTLWEPSLEYVDTHPELRGLRFAVPARRRLGSRLRTRVVERHDRLGAHAPGGLSLRVVNRAAYDVNRALDLLTRNVNGRTHARADVFHSPFNALPPAAERSRRMQYFLTVYDLIPQLFPESVASWGGDGWIREILGSIGPEDHVLAISEHTKRDLLTAYPAVTPEHVHVTPLAADLERFRPCHDAGRIAAAREVQRSGRAVRAHRGEGVGLRGDLRRVARHGRRQRPRPLHGLRG